MLAKVTRFGTLETVDVDLAIESADDGEATLVGRGYLKLLEHLGIWGRAAGSPVAFDVAVDGIVLRRCHHRTTWTGAVLISCETIEGRSISRRKSARANKIRTLVTSHRSALRAARDALCDVRTYSKPQPDDQDWSSHDFPEQYNRCALEAERALEAIGIDPFDYLTMGTVSRDVNVIRAGTHVEAWGEQVVSCALSKLDQGISEWARIEKDHALYNPSATRRQLRLAAQRRAGVKPSWPREHKLWSWSIAVTLILGLPALLTWAGRLAEVRFSKMVAAEIESALQRAPLVRPSAPAAKIPSKP